MPTLPYPLHPEPIKRNWLEHHPNWKIPLGCLTLLLLIAAFAAVLITIVMTSFHRSDVYQQAMSLAVGNPQVREQMGEPIKAGWSMSGRLNVSGSGGNADLSIPVVGSRAKGLIRAVAYKRGGVWKFTHLQVNIEGETASIDLLSQPPVEREF